jgi:uncharacterized phage-associated protein
MMTNPESAPIKRDDIDTARGDDSSRQEAALTVVMEPATRRADSDVIGAENVVRRQYPPAMTVSAHDVAAALRERIPGLPTLKLHKLLYYAQAHHLAATGEPMFGEPVVAWDKGPVVDALWRSERDHEPAPPARELSDGHLNIVDYVIARYGSLSGADLMHLTHGEDPWKRADQGRSAGGHARIRNEWMREYFLDEPHDEDEVWFTREKIAELTAGAEERLREAGPADPASRDRLWAMFDDLLGESRG